jgi:hypothetical protein
MKNICSTYFTYSSMFENCLRSLIELYTYIKFHLSLVTSLLPSVRVCRWEDTGHRQKIWRLGTAKKIGTCSVDQLPLSSLQPRGVVLKSRFWVDEDGVLGCVRHLHSLTAWTAGLLLAPPAIFWATLSYCFRLLYILNSHWPPYSGLLLAQCSYLWLILRGKCM